MPNCQSCGRPLRQKTGRWCSASECDKQAHRVQSRERRARVREAAGRPSRPSPEVRQAAQARDARHSEIDVALRSRERSIIDMFRWDQGR